MPGRTLSMIGSTRHSEIGDSMQMGYRGKSILIAILMTLGMLMPGPVGITAQNDAFDPTSFDVGLQPVADGFEQPTLVTHAGDERLFVVEQAGTIRVIIDGDVAETPFLDLTDRVGAMGSEQGLLGLAFAPNHTESGLFYVNYTDSEGNTVVSRFSLSDDPDVADPASEEIVLTQAQPAPNHNGGMLAFGPDSYLYIGFGDGGGQGDPDGNGQRLDTWLGKILRIEVDPEYTEGTPYIVPEDNPFVGDDSAEPEIWAVGLRNPWRFSFDRETGDLWIADVGQSSYEEVNRLEANTARANLGWSIMEGPSCYSIDPCDDADLIEPVFSYTHESGDGCSVTGGYVSRGEEFADLFGVYVLADYCTGLLWGGGEDATGTLVFSESVETGLNISSFGEGADGRLYLASHGDGAIYELVSPV